MDSPSALPPNLNAKQSPSLRHNDGQQVQHHRNQQDASHCPAHASVGADIDINIDPEYVSPHPTDGDDTAISREETETDFPEGGLQAWLVVFGCFCAMLSVYGLINSAAVFESYFSASQLASYSPSDIGWIFGLYLFIVFFAGVQVGPVFDRYGPRALVAVGSVLTVASQFLLGLCEGYYQIILTYAVLAGIGGALLNVPAYGAIAHYFKRRRGFATGMAATAGSVGGIVFPLLFQALIPKVGFAWTTRIIGFILLGLAVPANLLIRSRLPPSEKIVSVLPDLSAFQDLKFTLCCAGIWFMEWGIFIPLTFIVSYAVDQGQDENSSYTLLAALNAGSFFGRFLPGLVADKIGRFNVIISTITLCMVSILGLWLPAGSSQPLLYVFAVVFGFVSGSNLCLYPVCLGQLCDSKDYGRFYSTALVTASVGTLTSLPIGGALRAVGTEEQGWQSVIVFSALSYGIAASCFVGARVLAVSWNVKTIF
ncbi:riboflavin transporter MCH5 [Pseudomassariella vexata]|uniref:Riboflavin transporter MCH5 n=1 Tax=Pseudomassariella vexata TaxID=1141098 RepID=A0A1Y2DHE6_9PEZI|nr:riboflavin transporter MCH5 [Pseudomassariella vexata]ORY58524.1 riboflavin transporter MCH5 [Pseudomassariella vexata]